MILGSGPNRIGQGIEFDYCCCHAAFALHADGFETIMVNCNPETVSTDYDTSDRLYFEPLTLEDVLAIVEREKPEGVIVQFGGQTPLNLALELKRSGVPIVGTSPESIDLAEDRRRFGTLAGRTGIPQPGNGTALVPEEAARLPEKSDCRCWCGRLTSWAGARWRSPTTWTRFRDTSAQAAMMARRGPC